MTSETTLVTCRKCYAKMEACVGDEVALRLAMRKARQSTPRTRDGLAEATYYRRNPKTHIGDKVRPGLTYCGREVSGLWSEVVPWEEAERVQRENPGGVDWCRNCLEGRFAKPKSKKQKTRELKEGVRPA